MRDPVQRWSETLYWRHFSGERYLKSDLPCDPWSLVRGAYGEDCGGEGPNTY